ncbi:hypothetical protein ACGFYA_08810 [Streptomyces sp. NPDC048305]|uniref:hypothetical protein n=1 Tax=Streptomyces sp. NPDC048305 TaxID=3365532 RepID=UPI00371B7957
MHIRTHAALWAVLACAALGALLSGCILLYPAPQPPSPPQTLAPRDLIGTWRDEAHGQITFSRDGSFTATDVCGDYLSSQGDGLVREGEVPNVTGTGTWSSLTWKAARAGGRSVTTVRIEIGEWFADYDAGGAADSPRLWAAVDLDNVEYCILSERP